MSKGLGGPRPVFARPGGRHSARGSAWAWLGGFWLSLGLCGPATALAQRTQMDPTEVSIGQFRRYVQATGVLTRAERDGGGLTYEGGWQQRPGWVWHAPYGQPGADAEPAVHIAFDEAAAYCRWAGQRLPSAAEWRQAAYTESRAKPPSGWTAGKTYPFPSGDSARGAHCLGDCGDSRRGVPHAQTSRGQGHALVGSGPPGVNGLFDMGGNVWEWAEEGSGREQPTLGGSWWYGAGPMRRDHQATKPRDMAVVYIGFRCISER